MSWNTTKLAALASMMGVVAFVAVRVWAAGIPATGALRYAGVLEATDGEPISGEHNVEVQFWGSPSGGATPLCTSGSQTIALADGRFSLPLPDGCAAQVRSYPDIWVEVLADGASLGRSKVGAVPYAIEADRAVEAGHAEVADRLGATVGCPAGQTIRAIQGDGTVTCQADANTTYSAGTGLSLNGTTFSANANFLWSQIASTRQCGMVTGATANVALGRYAFCALYRADGNGSFNQFWGCELSVDASNNWTVHHTVNGPTCGACCFGPL